MFTLEQVNEYRKKTEQQFDGADAMPYVYAFPPAENPLCRFADSREQPKTASRAIVAELEKARILNALVICARFGSGVPREALLIQAYSKLTTDLCSRCGKAPLTRRNE